MNQHPEFGVVLAAMLISGCSSMIDAAPGMSDAEVAIVRGFDRFFFVYERSFNLYRVDDNQAPGFFGHSDAARVIPGRRLFVIGDEVSAFSSDDRVCYFEFDTEAGYTYELRPSGSVPVGAAAYSYTIDAQVLVNEEVVEQVRIPTMCLRTSLSCKSDDDCAAEGLDREFICAKRRPDYIVGTCELSDGPWIRRTGAQ